MASGSIVELIQLALAPVFLIVGIGQLLNAATARLARVIDRARVLEGRRYTNPAMNAPAVRKELKALSRRMTFANWSITSLTGAAVVICLDVILLFINGLIPVDLDTTILILFAISMILITGGAIALFFEVSVATGSLKITVDFTE